MLDKIGRRGLEKNAIALGGILRRFCLMLCFTSVLMASVNAEDKGTDAIRFGSVAMDTPAAMHHRLNPLIQYLTQALGKPVTLALSANMEEAITAVAQGDVDLAYLTPVAYLRAHAQGGAQLVVKTVTQGKGTFQLMVVVKEESAIQHIEELAGKSFAFGDPAALLQRATVVEAGMSLERLSEQVFLGHYDNISRAVVRGFYDAGILKDTTALKWQGKGLRILHYSPHLPPYNIAAAANADESMLAAMQAAFLKLDAKNEDHHAVIQALDKKYSGFAEVNDAEYNVVRRMIAPFE